MTAPLDGDLAWALTAALSDAGVDASRNAVEKITRSLSAEGFAKPRETDLSLGDLRVLAEKAQRSLGDILKGTRGSATADSTN